ncbi:MAG: hypothetical protein RH942_07405 [Kiloniellaceae bacterium]
MSGYSCRFRPWLDDPGVWPDWDLDPADHKVFAKALVEGATLAAERLTNLYGAQADTFGALGLIETLAAEALPEQDLRRAALAIAACDHHAARLGLPRMSAGGLTSTTNRMRWERLRPYLIDRATAAFRENVAEALLWRAIFGRIADNWVPQAQLGRALQQELSASGLFSNVEVTLELNPPVAGGGRWIAMQTKGALAEIRCRLKAREACLVELIRDAETDRPAVNLVVVYRLEEELDLGRDGVVRVRLWVYDPRRGDVPISLRLTLTDDRVQTVEMPADEELPSVKALRLVSLDRVEPPLFGWRRRLPRLPWGFFWWLKRLWLLFRSRRRA